MERELPPFVFARVVEAVLTAAEKKPSRKREIHEPLRYVI
jgi:hypothetical protein